MSQRPLIGMMLRWKGELSLLRACALAAAHYGADFYSFHYSDIREDCIVGTALEDNEWVRREFPYPDVIYDGMRRLGIARYEEAYRKLEGIPLDHTLKGRSTTKTKVYNLIRNHEELSRSLIPFIRLRDADSVLEFLDQHKQVVFKPNGGAKGRDAFTVEAKGDRIEWFDQQTLRSFAREELAQHIEPLLDENYLVQQMIHSEMPQGFPFHVRSHVSKNGQNRWVVAFKSVSLSLVPHMKITNNPAVYRASSTWADFLMHRFDEQPGGEADTRIDEYSMLLAQVLEDKMGNGFHEAGLDLGIDSSGRIWLFEAGLGVPRSFYSQMQLALPGIAYTLYVLERHRAEQGM
ncbi:YheC/YheD family protein [Saccharibacillus sp. CPCC 101409]|uniref:YheC/YheD family protein n=1 Tax=Saccharibacillus sp. CPCC 101409 TaxID=3058041 RepID=UPI00267240A2|nr:YheC/YheD family protein [Saccharibacillus sp. CPCC 101409]MDO3410556.1 YheC/YheD family protein [Saccharibacillus sp. CPCC 101409]